MSKTKAWFPKRFAQIKSKFGTLELKFLFVSWKSCNVWLYDLLDRNSILVCDRSLGQNLNPKYELSGIFTRLSMLVCWEILVGN